MVTVSISKMLRYNKNNSRLQIGETKQSMKHLFLFRCRKSEKHIN